MIDLPLIFTWIPQVLESAKDADVIAISRAGLVNGGWFTPPGELPSDSVVICTAQYAKSHAVLEENGRVKLDLRTNEKEIINRLGLL